MMDKETASEMIQAKALGCLDIDDKNVLDEYINLGGEFPWKEYGEYQNLTALLPIILEIEVPHVSVKDKVARKIYDAIADLRAKKGLRNADVENVEDMIYPETSVLGDQIFSTRKDDEEIPESDNEIDKTYESDREPTIPEVSENLSGEKISSEISPGIKNNIDEFSIEEPEIINETIDSLNLNDDMNIDMDIRIEQVKEHSEQETGKISAEETEANIKPLTPPVVSETVQSKYRTLLEQKSKRQTVEEEIPLKKDKIIAPELPKKKSSSGLVVDIIIYILLLAAIAFVYLKLSSEIDVLKREVNQLKQDTGALPDKSNSINNYLS
ncbi:MAG: hypothetical protein R6W68_16755 [Ignavibacteriaceae bacterium]